MYLPFQTLRMHTVNKTADQAVNSMNTDGMVSLIMRCIHAYSFQDILQARSNTSKKKSGDTIGLA